MGKNKKGNIYKDKQEAKQEEETQTQTKNFPNLPEQLKELNMVLFEVKGDGNCLFRSFADQIERNQHKHSYYRDEACNYMKENRDYFKFFMEDDNNLEDYIRTMQRKGSWGGNQEIYSLSMRFKVNVHIHALNEPVYIMKNFDEPEKIVHLAFHNECHYNSVRTLNETDVNLSNEAEVEEEENLFGVKIKTIKDKDIKYTEALYTQRGLVIRIDEFNFKKCHCGSRKKYSNCCRDTDVQGEYDEDTNTFYTNSDMKDITNQLGRIFI